MKIKTLDDDTVEISFKHKIILFSSDVPVAYTSSDINAVIMCKESISHILTAKVKRWIKTLDKADCIPIIFNLNKVIDQDVTNDFQI